MLVQGRDTLPLAAKTKGTDPDSRTDEPRSKNKRSSFEETMLGSRRLPFHPRRAWQGARKNSLRGIGKDLESEGQEYI